MSYPNSTAVTAGQATAASQYNNLRSDAVYLGGAAGTSGTLLDLLYQARGTITLTKSAAASVTLTASSAAPCAVMIGGQIYTASADQTVTISTETYPTAGRLYLFAAAASDGSFTPAVKAGRTAGTGQRLIGSLMWTGAAVVSGSIRTASEMEARDALPQDPPNDGRLTLSSGSPVPDTDISLSDTVYFTPYKGNRIGIYCGDGWDSFSFSELSLSVRSLALGVYDVFAGLSASGPALSCTAWGSTAARAEGALQRQDGIFVSGADSGKRYLGSFALRNLGSCSDTAKSRLLWNEDNRVMRPLTAAVPANYTGLSSLYDVWQPYCSGAGDTPLVDVLIPSADAEFVLDGVGIGTALTGTDVSYNRYYAVGICRDMNFTSPYTGNSCCAPVFCTSYGNSPVCVRVTNSGAAFRGVHTYGLGFYTNYSAADPAGMEYHAATGAAPGLTGYIMG